MRKKRRIVLYVAIYAVLAVATIGHVSAQQEDIQSPETLSLADDTKPSEGSVNEPPKVENELNEPAPVETSDVPAPSQDVEEPETISPSPIVEELEPAAPEQQETENEENPDEVLIQEEGILDPTVAEQIEIAIKNCDNRISYVAGLIGAADPFVLFRGDENYYDALAIYAMRHGQTENYPYDVVIAEGKQAADFQSIYWRLNIVNAAKTESGTVIRISRLSAITTYALSETDKDLFYWLTSFENRELIDRLLLTW